MLVPPPIRLAPLMVLCLAGCGARTAPADTTPFAEFGRYGFLVEVNQGVRLSGSLSVAPDTIVAQATGTTCRVAPDQPNSGQLVYACVVPGTTGVYLSIDRRSPARRSTWAVFVSVRRSRDACIAYRTWENGTRTCTQTMPEEYVEQVKRVGNLVVTR